MTDYSYESYLKAKAAYHTSLGAAFDSFAKAERQIVCLLGKLAGLNDDLTNALLSGVRADAAISQTRRVYRALSREVPIELNSALSQLKLISTDRNLIAHHGSIHSISDGMISSNFQIVLPDADMREISVSPKQLDAMALDLAGITLVFDHFSRGKEPTETPEFDAIVQDAVQFARKGAWHYKSETR